MGDVVILLLNIEFILYDLRENAYVITKILFVIYRCAASGYTDIKKKEKNSANSNKSLESNETFYPDLNSVRFICFLKRTKTVLTLYSSNGRD